MATLALVVLWSLIVSFLCSVAEAVVLTISHAHIQALGKTRAASILRHFKREIDLPIAAEHRTAVVQAMEVVAAAGQLVMEFPLPDNVEAAPVFAP